MTTKDALALALEALESIPTLVRRWVNKVSMFETGVDSDRTKMDTAEQAFRKAVSDAITAIKQAQDGSLIDEGTKQQAITSETGNDATPEASAITAGNGHAQEPVAVASIFVTFSGEREIDDWRHPLPVGRNLLYAHPAPKQAEPQIHCPEKLKKGGCQLHNLHCGWPKCNAAPTPPEAKA